MCNGEGDYCQQPLTNLRKNALDFSPPFQGEGRGVDGVNCMITASYQKQPHPHPNLPLEGEGTKSSKLALMPSIPPCQGGGFRSTSPDKGRLGGVSFFAPQKYLDSNTQMYYKL